MCVSEAIIQGVTQGLKGIYLEPGRHTTRRSNVQVVSARGTRHHSSCEHEAAKAEVSCLEETFGWEKLRKVGFTGKHYKKG